MSYLQIVGGEYLTLTEKVVIRPHYLEIKNSVPLQEHTV